MLKIVKYPNPILLKKCEKVTKYDDELDLLISNMFFTMKALKGIGLAANQVNVSKQVFVMNINDTDFYFINPIILKHSQEIIDFQEGCLSFPFFSQETKRSENITLGWYDLNQIYHERVFTDLHAICIQHEIDHLNGKTFIDNLSKLKKDFAVKRYFKNLNIQKT